ncbi:MAG TPA: MoxR family ATPase [Acidimicrobiales bacterium]|nr:MoxR family ATPase [Acidimicrobiales bacterium]
MTVPAQQGGPGGNGAGPFLGAASPLPAGPAAPEPPSELPPPPALELGPELLDRLARAFDGVVANVRSAYVGKEPTVRLALCCLMAEGHLLVEDHPGVGKTTLAKALARSLGLGFGRVQFTADLLPADVTGAMVYDRDSGRLSFRPGPVFTNVLLADELNRASPKAQSALLEAMEERQVSADGVSHPLPQPFMVLATQNPFDAAGTFPLPHSQRDRFLLRLSLGYPDRHEEDQLLASTLSRPAPEALAPVTGPKFLAAFAEVVRRAHVAPEVRGYVLDLVAETRSHPDLTVGASPRATLAVLRAAAALAVSTGRGYVVPDDVKLVAEPALGHRVTVHPAAELAGVTPSATILEILSRLTVPVGARR